MSHAITIVMKDVTSEEFERFCIGKFSFRGKTASAMVFNHRNVWITFTKSTVYISIPWKDPEWQNLWKPTYEIIKFYENRVKEIYGDGIPGDCLPDYELWEKAFCEENPCFKLNH